ncbi:MAG: DUF1844 domain-containing protein [Pirellulaceae bacterium]|jgi:hypothetical protein|nr:DUF1844 domain-containing protein [Pirellulaceae bacterium]MDP7015753.1 DUF1844 domain-containing protein [Pirellulaceae bacterium]
MAEPEEKPAPEEPRLVVDDDWKSQVEAEKIAAEQMRQQSNAAEEGEEEKSAADEATEIPPASFTMLISMISTQAVMSLGQFADPSQEEKPQVNLQLAKHNIDMLGVLEEKTKGNLETDESQLLSNALHELRMLYVATLNQGSPPAES